MPRFYSFTIGLLMQYYTRILLHGF